jgi:hypothetical protein
MTQLIQCIREQISRTDAARIVANASGPPTRVEQTLYYPYWWYRFGYSLTTLFGCPLFEIDCLVDGRKGITSTADVFETLKARPFTEDVLEICVDSDSGMSNARNTARHVLTKKYRAIMPFELKIKRNQLLYKKFWIVECGVRGAKVLIDSTTGKFITLTGENDRAAA